MNILGTPPSKWTADGALVLKQFLSSKIGRQFLLQMAWFRPGFVGKLGVDETALQAKFIAGYEDAINRILSLTEPPDERGMQPIVTYPDLDDDSLWPEPPKRDEAPAPKPIGSAKFAEPGKKI